MNQKKKLVPRKRLCLAKKQNTWRHFPADSKLQCITTATELERVCSQTQLCPLRCLMTILDNYMFRPLLAIFRLSLRKLKILLYNVRVAQPGCRDLSITRAHII